MASVPLVFTNSNCSARSKNKDNAVAVPGRPLARLRRFAAEQQEVTWSSRGVWSKRGKTQWVEETEPALVLMPVH